MNKKLEEKLYRKYPALFEQRRLPVSESAMGWGCQCGDGWYRLIDDICDEIRLSVKAKEAPNIQFTTVKEKFGLLRMYFTPSNEVVHRIIDKGGFLSSRICEICGKVSSRVSKVSIRTLDGFYKCTLCDKCFKKKTRRK
jgi:hypothetical protein